MRKIFSLLMAVLCCTGLFANSYWYRGGDNSWGATAMTVSTDGLYEYIQSSSNANQFKIAASADSWDYNHSYVQAGFNSTDVTNIGDYGQDNCYCWQSGSYYILVYYPNTAVNTTANPIICAATTLPDNSSAAQEDGDAIVLTFTYYNSTSGDGSAKLSTVEGIFDVASQAYVSAVNVGTQVYAGRKYKDGNDSIFSNLKFGSSSAVGELKFTLKNEVEVDSIVFRAAMYASNEGGDGFKVNDDNFTLSAGKLIFEDKVWKPTGKVSSIDIKQNKASKGRFFLTSITIYPKSAGGGDTPEPPTPAAPDSIFFVNVPGWDNLRVHLWGGTAAGTTWPGVEMTKLGDDDKINGYDVYKYVAVEGAYTQCIFSNNGENQTVDLNWTSGKYFYDGAWYAKTEIPEPIPAAVPLQGNIWKVVAETPVRAGSHYVDENLLKVDGVYATTLKANTRTIAGEEFTHAIQVRTDGYPSADNLAGKEKSGSTSLIITAKEDVDITLYYNRQVLNDTAIENDNKDLIVFDQAAIATKVTGTFAIDAILEGNNYLNATKKLALKKDHVYTVTASGTTLQLHGIKLEEHVPAMQIAGAWDVQEQAWVVNNMTLADNKLTASYEVELAKGDYEFKVLKDGAWLTKSNDGAYGLHREWPGVAGVTDNAENNLKLTADAAGTYTFTWTFANDSIGITFPAPEPPAAKENLYLVPNQWAEGDAKIAAWTWSKDGSINAFTEFFAPKAEGNDTLVAQVLADADSIIFVRFNATATEPKWNGGEGYQWNQTPSDSIQWEKAVFTIVPSEGYYTNGTWDVYTPAQPRLADGFYLIGQKGWAVDSLNADLLFTANPDNAGEYQLTVNLVANQSIKVVSVANDAIVAWYPDGQDNDYTIDEAHAGLKTIYFKPTGDQAWADFGGYFYIEPNQGTGVENGLSDQVQSTKVVRNGQLFIIRAGKTYTVQGVEVK